MKMFMWSGFLALVVATIGLVMARPDLLSFAAADPHARAARNEAPGISNSPSLPEARSVRRPRGQGQGQSATTSSRTSRESGSSRPAGTTSAWEDVRDFGSATADTARIGLEFHRDPVGATERLLNDDAYQQRIQHTADHLDNATQRVNARIEGALDAGRSLLRR